MIMPRPAFPFTLDGYASLLQALLAEGYQVRDFADMNPGDRHLILRHDVDMSLEFALRMAAREAEIGVCSTYFVLLRSELYNPFSAANLTRMGEILAQGHRIGLHFDASLYSDSDDFEQAVDTECRLLEGYLDRPVRVVSFHRPLSGHLGKAGRLAGRLHTYAPEFFGQIGYCSDSKGGWHNGAPLDNPSVQKGRAIHLLTHPIWWMEDLGASARDKLAGLVARQDQLYRKELAKNCVVYSLAPDSG